MSYSNQIYRYSLMILVIAFFLPVTTFSQEQEKAADDAEKIFKDIETGISARDISVITKYFDEQTFLSLSNSSGGYYSINQVHYVLTDYFSMNIPLSFRFENIITENDQPYATGSIVFNRKGKRESAAVYMAIVKKQGNWKISQLSIN